MSSTTRLPVAELADAAKADIADAIARIGDEDLAYPIECWREPRLRKDSADTL